MDLVVLCLVKTCLFDIPGRPTLFWEETGGVDLEGLGKEEGRETGCDVIYERRINKSKYSENRRQ